MFNSSNSDLKVIPVSIVIPTYNPSSLIIRSVSTILDQETEDIDSKIKLDLEIIIIDDLSTNQESDHILNALQKSDDRIKIVRTFENGGAGIARHHGIKEAKSEYIALLDDDDYWTEPTKLLKQISFLENPENKNIVVVGASKVSFVTPPPNIKTLYKKHFAHRDKSIRNKLLLRNQFVTSSVVFRKSIYDKAGGFSPLRLSEDYELWLKMGQFGKFANIDDLGVKYTVRPNSTQKSNQRKMDYIVLDLIKKFKNSYPNYFLALVKAYLRILIHS